MGEGGSWPWQQQWQWRHVHDSIGPIWLTVALGLKTRTLGLVSANATPPTFVKPPSLCQAIPKDDQAPYGQCWGCPGPGGSINTRTTRVSLHKAAPACGLKTDKPKIDQTKYFLKSWASLVISSSVRTFLSSMSLSWCSNWKEMKRLLCSRSTQKNNLMLYGSH